MLQILLSISLTLLTPQLTPQPDANTISVMSFNIRYGTANDGDNNWSNRKQLVFNVINDQDADIVGLQEALRFQIDEITHAAPTYAQIGVGRNDSRTSGEACTILYRADRFSIAQAGTFWLSDTPQVVASKSWGNDIPRICTWARLIDTNSGQALYILNSHFDHQSENARTKSAELIAEFVRNLDYSDPVILMGDFNASEDSLAIQSLTVPTETTTQPLFYDTFRQIHQDEVQAGTFNSWRGRTDGAKIDYILTQPTLRTLDAEILHTNSDGRHPSDHFPVTALLELPASDSTK